MTREETADCIKVMQAYVEGKQIQYVDSETEDWTDIESPTWNWDLYDYRIMPKPQYRPFKDADECWQEMLKHQPFGWLKHKDDDEPYCILKITDSRISMIDVCEEVAFYDYNETFKQYIFADGAPFGVKEVVWEN
ncbi:hypothetical protein [Leyella stercorea]|uniref:hypothetical protein n=1 Tax=Leyella stercorea TaxID=363265 RepID=UPI00242EC7FB|nr:hypothetical protein [Leyella stercorea]